MVDGKPRIGDEVYIHGYIDEIRNDVVIIRNEGGYFGTSDREMFYYEEDERGYGTMNEADRKTENSSEKPNNCEVKNYCDDCLYTDTCDSKEFFYACTSKATISKMEQVETMSCQECRHYVGEYECEPARNNVCAYEPKDEPQEVCNRPQKDCENCWKELHCRAKDEPQIDEEQFCREHKCTFYRPQEGGCTKNSGNCPFEDEPQTERSVK